ncbi:MAG TPA: hypothetical protein VLL03_06395 [Burkholderiales bacterium]|nr:hypothetical protein [Burkholderiales bacterium]
MTDIEVFQFFRTRGAVIGLAFDITGAVLVNVGVRTHLRQALLLERHVVEETIDDLGAPDLLARNEAFNRDRAAERVRASRLAWLGLVCFIIGFMLQAISAWPKST